MLTILQEVFPAVKAAEMAVKFRPLWWEGWQTLGRAQLNLGEVDLVGVALHRKRKQTQVWHTNAKTGLDVRTGENKKNKKNIS